VLVAVLVGLVPMLVVALLLLVPMLVLPLLKVVMQGWTALQQYKSILLKEAAPERRIRRRRVTATHSQGQESPWRQGIG